MRATRLNLAMTITDTERVLLRTVVAVAANAPLFEKALLKPAVMTNMETAPSCRFMPCLMGHRVTKCNEDVDGTVIESDADTTDYKAQPASNPVVKSPPNMRREMERAMADIDVVKNTTLRL